LVKPKRRKSSASSALARLRKLFTTDKSTNSRWQTSAPKVVTRDDSSRVFKGDAARKENFSDWVRKDKCIRTKTGLITVAFHSAVNLLKFAKDRIFTKEVLEQEQSYVIKAMEDANNADGKPKSLDEALIAEVFDSDMNEADNVEDLTGLHADGVYDLTALGNRMAAGPTNRRGVLAPDVQAALEASGVQYSHNNQRLIGNSKVEEFITRQAEKMHGTGGGGGTEMDLSLGAGLVSDPFSFGAGVRMSADFTRAYDLEAMDRMDELTRIQWAAAARGVAGPPLANFKRSGTAVLGAQPPRPSFASPYVPQSNLASGIAELRSFKSDPVIGPRVPRQPMTSSLSTAQMQSRSRSSSSNEVIEIEDDTALQKSAYEAAKERMKAAYREQIRRQLNQPLPPPQRDLNMKRDENGNDFIDLVDD
jgi:hypothetical protein